MTDSQSQAIDKNLEKQNSKQTEKSSREIWNKSCIDKYPVEANPVETDDVPEISNEETVNDHKWYAGQIKASQYFLQIVKCTFRDCCKSLRSNICNLL